MTAMTVLMMTMMMIIEEVATMIYYRPPQVSCQTRREHAAAQAGR